MRHRLPAPVVPPWVPPAFVTHVPGRGEMFYRHHTGGEPGAPTVLLLHGWTASADLQWFTVYRTLAERYPFVAIDVRGHGRGLRSEVPFTLEDAADDAAALVRHLGIESVVVVGYSMGGPLTMLTANRNPDLVDGVVLAATALEFHSGTQRARWWFLSVLEGVLRSRSWKRAGLRSLRRLGRRRPDLEPWIPWVAAELLRGDPTALAQAGRALRAFDARPFAGDLGVPAGVLVTTKDQLVPLDRQEQLVAATAAERIDLAGDHFVFWGEAEAFARALRRLVDGVVSRVAQAPAAAGSSAAPVPS